MRRALLVIALAACGGSSGGTDPTASIAGAYQLSTVNGAPLPYVISAVYNGPSGTSVLSLNSATLIVGTDGTYQMAQSQTRGTVAGSGQASTITSSGTYTAAGAGYAFRSTLAVSGTATLRGSTLSLGMDGVTYAFVR